MRLIVNAANIHSGGGLTLLKDILFSISEGYHGYLLIDARVPLSFDMPKNFYVFRIAPTLSGRLIGEWQLKRIARPKDFVICLGNLPPLFNIKGKIILFIQNRYLVDMVSLEGFSKHALIRIIIERTWLRVKKKCIHKCVVQTTTMQRLVKKELQLQAVVQPFVGNYIGKGCITQSEFSNISRKNFDFIYVACGEPHKNHRMLIKAWEILPSDGTKPSLCLTLEMNKYRKLCEWIEEIKNASALKINNVGELPLQEILNLYKQSRALVYPSILETVGLPLVEAKAAGIPIIAAELDYVRDMVNPEQTFNPYSALSIARAVKRFLNVKEQEPNFLDSKKFLKNILTNL